MTFSHLVYIPVMLLIGIVCGYVLGSRATRRQMEEERDRASK